MARKVHPKSFRLGILEDWQARWFYSKNYKQFLEEDEAIRTVIRGRLRQAGIDATEIERSGQNIKVRVATAKPGLVIGRSGKGIEELKSAIDSAIVRIRKKNTFSKPYTLSIDIEEVKRSDVSASIVAQNMVQEIERRVRFRRVMKQSLERIMEHKDVKGAKIRVSGRLDGSEISRAEWLSSGKVPMHTLRSKIDYGEATAFCTYGTVGIKVWIYKGEVF
ncbi:MAG: 30S ribosomal protein S3 [Parcubacteria group bacterium RIFCSPLOWO2_01_FULL_48_18]|nr:ribosomal protein S3 [uncultured bacterium]OHB22329.1 MAG: 30S ribosomal protein S3 [Parcubacteria group bacterium RIFCSPLOWO2_01_FULL_48_18]OHB24155.1 MAG: 30S ribosomal protein S3 [Parcubacteria group bacterium RIFCSPHIGHO2_02_FULL_48_10b]